MSVLLIDDAGIEWPGTSRKLREAFGSPYSGSEFVDYAIANLGFVGIDNYGASCQLRLRPSLISEACWRGVTRWLRRAQSERVVVSSLGAGWSYELIRSTDVALRRIEAMIAQAENARPDDFLSRSPRLDELHPASPLSQIVRNWSSLSAPSGQRVLKQLVLDALGDRYVMVGKAANSERLTFQAFGDGLFAPYETWRTCAVGAPIEEQPDRQYGRWVAASYAEAFKANEPRIADIDAIVRWPHSGRSRMRYKRLIVPLRDSAGLPVLLGGPLFDNQIDLRARTK